MLQRFWTRPINDFALVGAKGLGDERQERWPGREIEVMNGMYGSS